MALSKKNSEADKIEAEANIYHFPERKEVVALHLSQQRHHI
jgi:hypothetical protein